jgi:acetyl-CoA decarbonylase/synthase complex subunit epsilon
MADLWTLSAISGWKQATVLEPAKAKEMLRGKYAVVLGAHTTKEQYEVVKKFNMITIGPVAQRLGSKAKIEDPFFTIQGDYEALAFLGFDYWFLNQMFQHLKHFSKINSISIERFYHPNAKYSLKNMTEEEWVRAMK